MTSGAMAEVGLTFDDILGAVQESSRGRWFLDEFQKRQEDKGSAKILAAIGKIETRMEAMAHDQGIAQEPAGELTKLRRAIATARREIALQEIVSPDLSAEGRMFARLAEMARKTLPASPANDSSGKLTSSVVRALSLIDEIDVTLNGDPPAATATADAFFKADATLFEPVVKPPRPQLVAVAAAPPAPPVPSEPVLAAQPKSDEPKRGARLVINRLDAANLTETKPAPKPEPEITPLPQPVDDQQVTATAAAKPEEVAKGENKATPRIVIVRRKPEDLQHVSLDFPVPEQAAESAA